MANIDEDNDDEAITINIFIIGEIVTILFAICLRLNMNDLNIKCHQYTVQHCDKFRFELKSWGFRYVTELQVKLLHATK